MGTPLTVSKLGTLQKVLLLACLTDTQTHAILWCRPALAMEGCHTGASSCHLSCLHLAIPLRDRLEPCLVLEERSAAALPKIHQHQNKHDFEGKKYPLQTPFQKKKRLSLPAKRTPREVGRTRHFGALIFLIAHRLRHVSLSAGRHLGSRGWVGEI